MRVHTTNEIGNSRYIYTFVSGNGAVEHEIVEVGAEDRKPTLTCVGLQRGLDHGADELSLIHHEPDRARAAQNGDANQQAAPTASSALAAAVLLLLLVNHHY